MKLLLLVGWLLSVQAELTHVQTAIEQLSRGIRAKTHIFHFFNYTQQVEAVIRSTKVPHLLITGSHKLTLRRYFSAEILSVVFYEPQHFQLQGRILEQTLDRWRHTDVLFVLNASQSTNDEWSWLFEWCWQRGIYNVLLTDASGVLLRFESAPSRQVHRTNLSLYLQKRNQYYNFHGYPIRVGAGNNPPRALLYYDARGQLIFSGTIPRALKLFAQRYNFTLQLVLLPNFRAYDVFDCFRYLQANKVDVCADNVFSDISHVVSRPQFMGFGHLMVPLAPTAPMYRYFVAPFEWDLWLLIACTTCALTLLTSFLCWQQSGRWRVDHFLLETLSSILCIPFHLRHLRGQLGYCVYVLLFANGFLLANFYLALLSSIFSTNLYEAEIESLADLRAHNTTILITAIDAKIFRTFGVPPVIWERVLEVPNDVYLRHRNALDPRYAYSNLLDKCELYLYQQKFMRRPRLKILNEPANSMWSGMPMRTDWLYEELFNNHMTRIFELGFSKFYMERSKEEAVRIGQLSFYETEFRERAPLSVEYFEMPAWLLGLGYLAAAISFVLELFLYAL